MKAAFDRYHDLVLSVWADHAPSALHGMHRMPYLGQAPAAAWKDKDLVILGLNPSARVEMLAEHWTAVHRADLGSELEWDPSRSAEHLNALRTKVIALDQYSRANYPPYYGPLEIFAASVQASDCWLALDVFPMRASVQRALEPQVPWNEELPAPAKRLFDGLVDLLAAIRPKVVLVANAHASRLLRRNLSLERQGDLARYETARLPFTTFILSRMFTGRRAALDEFSRERLAVDVRAALAAAGRTREERDSGAVAAEG